MHSPLYESSSSKKAAEDASKALQKVVEDTNISTVSIKGCALTVQVLANDGMSLLVAKKAVTLVLLLENRLLIRLCEPSPRPPEKCYPIVSKSAMANLQLPEDLSVLQLYSDTMSMHLPWKGESLRKASWNNYRPEFFQNMLRVLWSAEDTRDILRHLWTDYQGKCWFALGITSRNKDQPVEGNVPPDYIRDKPSTFEFLYPGSTLGEDFIKNWLELSERIIQIACLPPQEFRDIAEAIWRTLEEKTALHQPAWPALLQCLELETQIDYWDGKVSTWGYY
ncbi:hypothetical protein J3458_020532 [Metarhizium acridum]|uniref:uncharacterized protein n=1 Tax=Metarhizium acridum TaxID=92637 RepID=UPI001C6C8875|nr:hypothetical protein J3458_020532 [Metarhizium acridum]